MPRAELLIGVLGAVTVELLLYPEGVASTAIFLRAGGPIRPATTKSKGLKSGPLCSVSSNRMLAGCELIKQLLGWELQVVVLSNGSTSQH